MLQSLALDSLESKWEKGIILYNTYEENEEQVNEQFLNALANVELTKRGGNAQLRIIDDYLRSFPTDPSILEQGATPQKGLLSISSKSFLGPNCSSTLRIVSAIEMYG